MGSWQKVEQNFETTISKQEVLRNERRNVKAEASERHFIANNMV